MGGEALDLALKLGDAQLIARARVVLAVHATEAVTVRPLWLTGLPQASVNRTAGCTAKATPLSAVVDGCVAIISLLATPAITEMFPDVTLVKEVAVKRSVRLPIVPPIESPENVATPLAFVVAVFVPPSVPPPLATAAVTTTPDWLIGLFDASTSWITGC